MDCDVTLTIIGHLEDFKKSIAQYYYQDMDDVEKFYQHRSNYDRCRYC